MRLLAFRKKALPQELAGRMYQLIGHVPNAVREKKTLRWLKFRLLVQFQSETSLASQLDNVLESSFWLGRDRRSALDSFAQV